MFYFLTIVSMPFGDADVEERKARMRGGEVYEFKPDQKGEFCVYVYMYLCY